MRILPLAAAASLVAMLDVAAAADFGDPQRGLTYARAVCAECHAVESGQELSPNPAAPSFTAVAKTPGMTPRALVVWLQTSHKTMPNLMVSEEDRDNVIAYITGLRPQTQ